MQKMNTFILSHAEEKTMIVTMYSLYLALSITLTVWVAHTLQKNGHVFLVEVFDGDEGMASSVNHLLVVGFYLVNLGFVCLAMKTGDGVATSREVFETLSMKMGQVLLALGAMHFLNLLIFNKIRHRGAAQTPAFPVVQGPYHA
jgi:hypothetical protein